MCHAKRERLVGLAGWLGWVGGEGAEARGFVRQSEGMEREREKEG